jgi:hypothetical protein
VNATAIAAAAGVPAQVTAVVSVTGAVPVQINNPTVTVGFPHAAVSPAVVSTLPSGGVFAINPSAGVNPALAANPAATGAIDVLLQFTGTFAGAFKPRTSQQSFAFGSPFTAEEAFDGAGFPLAPNSPPLNVLMGRADQGTQFIARFQVVPPGVQVFVTTRDVPQNGLTSNNPDTPAALAILKIPSGGATSPGGVPLGSGGTTSGATAGIPIAPVGITNGAGEAVWEWVGAPQPNQVQTLEFGVVLAMTPVAGIAPPAVVTATVNLSLGPLSTVATASGSDPVPRFVDTSKPQNLFSLL